MIFRRSNNEATSFLFGGGDKKCRLIFIQQKTLGHIFSKSQTFSLFLSLFPPLPFIVSLTDSSFYPLFYSHPLSFSLLCSILHCLLRYFILFLEKNVRRNHTTRRTKLGLQFWFPQPTKSLLQSLLSPICCVCCSQKLPGKLATQMWK